jgi:hypothetical protein
MLRSIGLAGVTVAALVTASPAAAQARCPAPEKPGWRSCLTASHRTTDGGQTIHLTKVRPRLVARYQDGCPTGADRRTVAIRADGELLVRARVNSRCRRGVARYDVTLRLDLDLPEGTVVRSNWSGIPDGATAPSVELKAS